MTCLVTQHAVERAVERLGVPAHRAVARIRLIRARSRHLPWRFATDLLGPQKVARWKGAADVRVAGSVLLVCRGSRVLTVWPLDADGLATVLVWRLEDEEAAVWMGLSRMERDGVREQLREYERTLKPLRLPTP